MGQLEGENKIVIARRVLGRLVDGLPDDSEVGVIAYGHRREGDCDDIETVVPMGALDKESVKATVNALNPKGKTPITKSVQAAFDSLAGHAGGATVILISDGLETCGGDPCAAVRSAKERGIDFILHVVGFDVAGEDVSSLECAAQAGNGLFLSAENADELSSALDEAVEMAAEDIPDGRLSVKAIADGKLHDAAVSISHSDTGEDAGGGRTYTSEDTNPRLIPLADGRYDVKVLAVGIKGDITRMFEIEIVDGSVVEKVVDFSTGELSVGVTRNGELSDAVYRVNVPGGAQVAGGRTYTAENSNPARARITAGTYDVWVGSVEIAGRPEYDWAQVTIEPGGLTEVSHNFSSGVLKVGAERDGVLVDATLGIVNIGANKSVGQGRTYTSESSNPKSFTVEPGQYKVTVREIRGERRTFTVSVAQGEEVVRMVDPAGGE